MSNRSGGYSCHTGPNSAQPEIHVIKLHKSTNGMGLSIVAAKVRLRCDEKFSTVPLTKRRTFMINRAPVRIDSEYT